MKKEMIRWVAVCVSAASLLSSGGVLGAECAGRFFAADDNENARPLKRATGQFAQMLAQATSGNAVEQRNLAVSYETGYLVSRCADTARMWYAKAAASGDEVAQAWLARHQAFASLRAGPECIGDRCAAQDADANRVTVLYADAYRKGHYYAPVTINGRTVRGLIDTGASSIAMSAETAKTLGINVDGGKPGNATTANGTISTSSVVVPLIDVAGIKLRDVAVAVGITGETLIGMSFLSRVNMTVASGTLSMSKRQ